MTVTTSYCVFKSPTSTVTRRRLEIKNKPAGDTSTASHSQYPPPRSRAKWSASGKVVQRESRANTISHSKGDNGPAQRHRPEGERACSGRVNATEAKTVLPSDRLSRTAADMSF